MRGWGKSGYMSQMQEPNKPNLTFWSYRNQFYQHNLSMSQNLLPAKTYPNLGIQLHTPVSWHFCRSCGIRAWIYSGTDKSRFGCSLGPGKKWREKIRPNKGASSTLPKRQWSKGNCCQRPLCGTWYHKGHSISKYRSWRTFEGTRQKGSIWSMINWTKSNTMGITEHVGLCLLNVSVIGLMPWYGIVIVTGVRTIGACYRSDIPAIISNNGRAQYFVCFRLFLHISFSPET